MKWFEENVVLVVFGVFVLVIGSCIVARVWLGPPKPRPCEDFREYPITDVPARCNKFYSAHGES